MHTEEGDKQFEPYEKQTTPTLQEISLNCVGGGSEMCYL